MTISIKFIKALEKGFFAFKNQNSIYNLVEILIRLTIGLIFIESGYGKFQKIDQVIQFFENLHIPFAAIQAPFVASVELIFGLFIILGFLTRLSSLLLIITMLVALLTAKKEDLTGLSSLFEQIEYLYILLLSVLFALGANKLSLDHALRRL